MVIDPLILISISLPIVILLAIIVWKNPLLFFGVHVSSRVILDGLSEITYKNILLNISIAQIYSISFILFLGVYLYFKKGDIKKIIPPVFFISLICLSYLLSGIVSNDWIPVIENITKWVYMILLSGLIVLILNHYKLSQLILVLFISVMPAVIIQIYAILTNNYSIASGGHIAYIGGYMHQSMLSYLLLVFTSSSLYLSIYYKNFLIKFLFILLTLYGMIAIYLCGYRTSYLALIVFLLFAFLFYIKKSNISKKIFATYLVLLFVIIIVYFIGSDIIYRLNDIVVFLKSPFTYLDFSGNAIHTEMFSGRLYIINTLMFAYLTSSFVAIIFGMGIDSSIKLIGTYPHNEFLSALVETGIFGFVIFNFFIAFYLNAILKNFKQIKNVEESIIIGLGVGLLVMTLATMPFRCMRAMIIFGLVLGVAHYKNNRINNADT